MTTDTTATTSQQEARYQTANGITPGLSASLKFLDPVNLTQVHITVQACTPRELFQSINEIQQEALAREYLIDQWPLNPDQQRIVQQASLPPQQQPHPAEPIDPFAEFGVPAIANQDELIAYMLTEHFRSLPLELQTQIAVQGAQAKQHPASQPAYLHGLLDEHEKPLMALPAGCPLPSDPQRPQKLCTLHNVWMYQRSNGNGSKWFSHPVGNEFCKGRRKAASA